jgi:hypothetical protein
MAEATQNSPGASTIPIDPDLLQRLALSLAHLYQTLFQLAMWEPHEGSQDKNIPEMARAAILDESLYQRDLLRQNLYFGLQYLRSVVADIHAAGASEALDPELRQRLHTMLTEFERKRGGTFEWGTYK